VWLDRLRGVAAIGMIVVHVTHALLREDLRDTAAFRAVEIVFGLVAPAFLFCVGASFAAGGGARARLLRAAALFALGYAIHASGLVAWLRTGRRDELAVFLQADILQVIALALALLLALSLALSAALPEPAAERAWTLTAAGLGVMAFALAPFAHRLGEGDLPAALLPYFSHAATTQFPVVPWLGHALLAAAAMRAFGARPAHAWLVSIALAAVALAAVAWLVPLPAHDPWRAGPSYALARFAAIALAGGALARVELPRVVDDVLSLFGRRSLFLYVTHIALVYARQPWSLRSLVGPRLSPLACAIAAAAVVVVMGGIARGYESARKMFRSSERV
jgi:surface polysaccharide O-acyltransferase-like enzyme